MLRTFGIEIAWQGSWSGGAVVLVVLALLGAPDPSRPPILRLTVSYPVAALALVLIVGCVQTAMVAGADLVMERPPGFGRTLSHACGFAVAWLPTACVGTLVSRAGVAGWSWGALAPSVVFSMGASALWFQGPTALTVLACLLAAVGAGFAGAFLIHPDPAPFPATAPDMNSAPHRGEV